MKAQKYILFILIQLTLLSILYGQRNAWGEKELDLSFFIQKYDTCTTVETLDHVFEVNNIELEDKQYRQLNLIAYSKSVSRRGDHTKALEILSSVNEEIEKASSYIKGEYNGALGAISYSSENPVQAEVYLLKSVEFLKKTDKKSDLQAKYTSLGMVATALEDYSKAKKYYNQALSLQDYGSEKNNLYLELNMALTESHVGNYREAKQHFIGALNLFKSTPDIYAEIRTYGNLGDIYVHQDSLQLAEQLYLEGLKLAEENGFDLGGVRFNLSLSDLYLKLNNTDLAYKHRVTYDSLRSALDLNEVVREMTALEKKHEIHLKNVELEGERERNMILTVGAAILLVLVFFLAYQWKVLKHKNKVLLKKSKEVKGPKKSDKPLTNEQATLIANLEKLMKDQHYFKNPNVNLERTAKKLNTNRSYLSEAINECYEIGFSRWLNELRIQESLKLLSMAENDKYSIEGIAKMVGFSSISSFNSNFKSITGLTPSYFRKNRINNS